MDTQMKLFDEAYVESQVRQVKEVRQKKIDFGIYKSDRSFSRTIYVNFICNAVDGTLLKGCTLRISDHLLPHETHRTFLVKPDNFLDKKTKEKFRKALELTASDTIKKTVRKNLNKLTKRFGDEKNDI